MTEATPPRFALEADVGPHRVVAAVDASKANVAYGNGVLSISFPKAGATEPASIDLGRTGHARGLALGHVGTRGGATSHPR